MRIDEANVEINLWAQFDMSTNTSLQIRFTDPNGVVKPLVAATLNAVAVDPPDDIIDEDTGLALAEFPANESVKYVTSAGEFDVAGTWTAEVIYTNGPSVYKTEPILVCVSE